MWVMGSQVEDGRVSDGCVRPAVKLQLPQEGREDRKNVIGAPLISFPQLLNCLWFQALFHLAKI